MKRVIKAVISVTVISLIFYFILSFIIMMVLFDGQYTEYRPDSRYSLFLKYDDLSERYNSRDVKFDSYGYQLSGKIYSCDKPKAVVIIAHRKDSSGEMMLGEASAFCDSGYASMLFDLTANGDSEGVYQGGPVRPMYDVESAVRFIRSDSEFGSLPILLYGYGAGGYGCCSVLNGLADEISGVVSVGAYGNSYDMILDYGQNIIGVFAYLEYPVAALYNSILSGGDAALDAVSGINSSETPVLVINAADDEMIKPHGSALTNYVEKFTNPNAQYFIVEGKGHANIMRSADAIEIVNNYNKDAYTLNTQYSGNTPMYLVENLIADIDRNAANENDSEMMNRVIVFFDECISKTLN